MTSNRKYRYTKNLNNYLTEEQRQFYEDNGYIIIKKNVSDELLEKVCQRFIEICNGNRDGVMMIMKEPSLKNTGVKGEYLVNKIQDFLFDDTLFEYTTEKSVVDVVESIIGPNITAAHSMLINKPPDAKAETSLHPMHQDLHYFPFRPSDSIVASWTAIENVNEENGCLYVVPGSHKKGTLYNHIYPNGIKNKMYHGVFGFDREPKVHVIMEKGDTVFFHPLLLHGSGPNKTKGFRKAISCHYADSNSHFIDVRGTSQENIATEVEEISRRVMGAPLNFVDVWKAKSKLVKGEPGTFQNVTSHL